MAQKSAIIKRLFQSTHDDLTDRELLYSLRSALKKQNDFSRLYKYSYNQELMKRNIVYYIILQTCIQLLPCRTLSEFWHWFVANVPGDNIDEGEIIFELLFPLVLPEGDGDHRYKFVNNLISTNVSYYRFLFFIIHATDYFYLDAGLVTSYLSNPKDLTMPMKEDQRMHVVQICPMVEDLSSKPY